MRLILTLLRSNDDKFNHILAELAEIRRVQADHTAALKRIEDSIAVEPIDVSEIADRAEQVRDHAQVVAQAVTDLGKTGE